MSPSRPSDSRRTSLRDRVSALAPPAITLVVVLAFGIVALAQQQATINQNVMTFEPAAVRIKAGQSVVFVNDDPYGHNVYSLSTGGQFDIGLQQPGAKVAVPFPRPGSFDVLCRIHPKMRAQVIVF